MIQNLIIIKNGATIFNENFGECHKLNSNPMLLSAFFDALLSFAEEFEQGTLEQLKFKKSNINYLKFDDLLYIAITDITDETNVIKSKLNKVAELFTEKYEINLLNHSGEFTQFRNFSDILIELGIAQRNCGEHSDCSECSNRITTSPTFTEIIDSKK